MAEETVYLELSETGGGAHKFYEVTTNYSMVKIRYGRIGDQGATQTSTHASEEEAEQFARKKIREKMRKGYEQAVVGQRQKRRVTRRSMLVGGPAPTYTGTATSPGTARRATTARSERPAPVIWKFGSGKAAFGIFIDEDRCWLGNEAGRIFGLDHTGQVQAQFTLPDGVKCLIADDAWLYAGCDDGNVYDLSGKIPRVSYQIAPDVDIFWLDILNGSLAISDADGRVALVNHEDESEWLKTTRHRSGWMVRCGEEGVYHGHSGGVTMYHNLDGRVAWEQPTGGAVLFGWQDETMVYAGTGDKKVYSFTKSGLKSTTYHCDHTIFSCATAEEGKYIFAGDNFNSIYCFNKEGQRLWKLDTGCGSAYSMQYFKERLYIVTTTGHLACIDVSEAAIQAAQQGTLPQTIDVKAPPPVATPVATTLETTTSTASGVIVECFRESGRLRIRVISDGYDPNMRVQFPQNIREENARYLVDEVRSVAHGNFYRAYGDIKKLV